MISIPRYNKAVPIVLSNTVDFSNPPVGGPNGKPCDAIFVGTAGAVAVVLEDGTAVTLSGCLAGTIYPIRARRVNATNTAASNLVALYLI